MSRRPTLLCFLLLVSATLLVGCRNEHEQARIAAKNFVAADYVHDAPFRSYLFISASDKTAMTRKEYADWHDREPRPDSIVSVEVEGLTANRANATAKIDDSSERLVLVREDGRWRVHLGLVNYLKVQDRIVQARKARVSGDLDQALQELVQADLVKVDGTLGTSISKEVASLRSEVEAEERQAILRDRFKKAETAPLEKLEVLYEQLEKSAQDAEWAQQLDEVRARLDELRVADAKSGISLSEQKVRRFYEGNALVHELDATVENRSSVAIVAATAEVTMIQAGDALGTRSIGLPLEEKLAPNSSQTFTVRIPDTPIEWKSREIEVQFNEVEIGDE